MRRFLPVLCLLALASGAVAQGVVPSYTTEQVDLDFEHGRYWQGGPTIATDPTSFVTVSRASTAYEDNLAGIWTSFGNNVLRVTNKGALIEESRTNVALWCRDLTNAAWVKSNITAALDQTGIDGAANSASSLTATAGNGTALQAITLGSSARFQSAFVKRLVGAGTVNMTMDNGATWTAITVTTAWARVTIPTQTLANPTVGFRLVTSGDAIAVDFVQNENGGDFASSPILTTTASATRQADVVTLTTVPVFGAASTLLGKGTTNTTGTSIVVFNANGGNGNNRIQLGRDNSNVSRGLVTAGGSNIAILDGASWLPAISDKLVVATQTGDQAASFNGASAITAAGVGSPPLTVVRIGSNETGALQWNGYVERVAVWPNTRLPNAQLQSMTAP